MFLKLNRILRHIILLLGIVYTLSGTGMATFILQGAHDYYAHVIFPCKGSGCACDKAGYELRGCRCDHSSAGKKSCCSEQAVPVESCCTKKIKTSCCSEESEDDVYPIQIKPRGCQGQVDEDSFSVVKHCPVHVAEPPVIYLYSALEYNNCVKSLFSQYFSPPGKVPIFS